MDIAYSSDALKGLKAMPKADAERVREAVTQVAEAHPKRMSFVTEMVGQAGGWRLRKGVWRAIYVIEGGRLTVTVVGHRREVYD